METEHVDRTRRGSILRPAGAGSSDQQVMPPFGRGSPWSGTAACPLGAGVNAWQGRAHSARCQLDPRRMDRMRLPLPECKPRHQCSEGSPAGSIGPMGRA